LLVTERRRASLNKAVSGIEPPKSPILRDLKPARKDEVAIYHGGAMFLTWDVGRAGYLLGVETIFDSPINTPLKSHNGSGRMFWKSMNSLIAARIAMLSRIVMPGGAPT
jgi:hypothetical protein